MTQEKTKDIQKTHPPREIGSIELKQDYETFVELSRLSFGSGITTDYAMYDWYFNQNPYNPPQENMMYVMRESLSSDAPESGKKVIASDGLYPFDLYIDGKVYKSAHSVESMTHPDYMRQGIFRQMTENSLAKAKEHGLDLVLGLANSNSYGAYVKFGWRTLFEKRLFVRPVRIATRLRRRIRIPLLPTVGAFFYGVYDSFRRMGLRAALKGYRSEVLDAVPAEVEACYLKYRDQFGAHIVRDYRYLNYRYNQRPDKKYTAITIRKEGADASEGFAVVRVCPQKGHSMLTVAEFFCRPSEAKALAAAVVEFAYGANVEYITLCIGGNEAMQSALLQCGFAYNKRPLLNNMMIAVDISGKVDLDSLDGESRWMMTQGDGESELHI